MKIVFLTAGAAGMYCGSCMHDNALAKALIAQDVDCLLQPLYTPIRTDEASVASTQVFFGGVNIYLLQRVPLYRLLPAPLKRLLDRPGFLNWATRRAAATDAAALGDLTISMLRGEQGNQREEVERLVQWLGREVQPDAIVLSNLLISGPLPAIRRELPNTKIVAILQGDDAFLDHLPTPARTDAIALMSQRAQLCDAIVVNSQFYGQQMTRLLDLDAQRVHVVPLAIDTAPFAAARSARPAERPPTVGYFARISPEKGFHHLVDAFLDLAQRPGGEAVRLEVAGWLGAAHQAYFATHWQRLHAAGLGERVRHHGSPDLDGKLAILQSLDVLCVPTEHQEPKGLFVLEALAAGAAVVLPAVGAFPEIVQQSGGGLLVPPGQSGPLADALQRLLGDAQQRGRLAAAGRSWVLAERTIERQATALRDLISKL